MGIEITLTVPFVWKNLCLILSLYDKYGNTWLYWSGPKSCNCFREYLNPLSWVDHWYSSTSNSTAMYSQQNKPDSKLKLELWEESGLRQNIPLWDVGSRSVHTVDVYQQPCRSALINMASDMLLQYVCKQTSPSPYRLFLFCFNTVGNDLFAKIRMANQKQLK